jgi:hypothetical protein
MFLPRAIIPRPRANALNHSPPRSVSASNDAPSMRISMQRKGSTRGWATDTSPWYTIAYAQLEKMPGWHTTESRIPCISARHLECPPCKTDTGSAAFTSAEGVIRTHRPLMTSTNACRKAIAVEICTAWSGANITACVGARSPCPYLWCPQPWNDLHTRMPLAGARSRGRIGRGGARPGGHHSCHLMREEAS